jgi:membrane-bound lytic murein transglycosylase D
MNLRTHFPRALAAIAAAFLLPIHPAFGQGAFNPSSNIRLPDIDSTLPADAIRPVSTARPASLLIPTGAPETPKSLVQKALQEADKHFQYGKFSIQEEKFDQARIEFDAALNVLLALPADLPDRALAERKFEELIRLIHRYDLDSLGASTPKDEPVYTQSPLNQILHLTFPVDPRLKDRVAAQIQAGQSQLPLTVNDAVLSYINYFTNAKGSRTLLAGLRRSGRYRDMILRIFAEEGVPRELIHVAQAESGFAPRAVSYKSATGMWQFMRPRGHEYGLTTSNLHDDRLDPEKATRAAARHLRDLYNQAGDWLLAMAAYNCGPACVERAVQRTGYADYWELRARNAIPKDTRSYVPVIIAMAILTNNLQEYGLEAPPLEPALTYDTIEVDAQTNLGLIADAADVPVSEIREMNPALIRGVAPKDVEVRVPAGKAADVLAALEAIPSENRKAWRLHRVAGGDTLASISKRYSAPASSIIKVNTRLGESFFDSPRDGELILIPAREVPVKVAVKKSKSRRTVTRSKARTTVSARSAKKRPAAKRVASASTKRRTVAR